MRETFQQKMVSRTLWITVGIFSIGTALLLHGAITGDNWVTISQGVMMSYAAKSVGEKWVATKEPVHAQSNTPSV